MEVPNLTSTPSGGRSIQVKRTVALDPSGSSFTVDTREAGDAFVTKCETANSCASASIEGSRSTTEQSATSSTVPLECLLKMQESESPQTRQNYKSPERAVPPALVRLAEKYALEALRVVEELHRCARKVLKAIHGFENEMRDLEGNRTAIHESELAAFGAGCAVVGALDQQAAIRTLAHAFCSACQEGNLESTEECIDQVMICVPGGIISEDNAKLRSIIDKIYRQSESAAIEMAEPRTLESSPLISLLDALSSGTHQVFLFEVVDTSLFTASVESSPGTDGESFVTFREGKDRKSLFAELQKRIDLCLSLIRHALDMKSSSLVRKSKIIESIIAREEKLRKRVEQRRERVRASRKRKGESESYMKPNTGDSQSLQYQRTTCSTENANGGDCDTAPITTPPVLPERRAKRRHSRSIGNESESENIRHSVSTLHRFLRRRPDSDQITRTPNEHDMQGKSVTLETPELSLRNDSSSVDQACGPSEENDDHCWVPDHNRGPRLRLSVSRDVHIAASWALHTIPDTQPVQQPISVSCLLNELRNIRKICFARVFLQRWSRGAMNNLARLSLWDQRDVAIIESSIGKMRYQIPCKDIDADAIEKIWRILQKRRVFSFSSLSGRIVRPGYRYLHFDENCRPPYYGPWPLLQQIQRIRPRAPCAILDSDLIDYDFDSDADWEEDDCGEDLSSCSSVETASSSGDSLEEENGADSDADFIDDEQEQSENDSNQTPSRYNAHRRRRGCSSAERLESNKSHDESLALTSASVRPLKTVTRIVTGVRYDTGSDNVLCQFRAVTCRAISADVFIEKPSPSLPDALCNHAATNEVCALDQRSGIEENRQESKVKSVGQANIWSAFQQVIPKRVRPSCASVFERTVVDPEGRETSRRCSASELDALQLTAGASSSPSSAEISALGSSLEKTRPSEP
jgi:hypothetical protein